MIGRVRCGLVLCAAMACAASVRATTIVPADLGELARDARAIVRGRVVAADARWSDDRRSIETLVTIDVEEYLKGAWGQTVQFRVPGGELGRYRSIFVGAPEFAVGDRVVIFLGARGPSLPYLLGLSQGVYRIVRATGDAGWAVTPPPFVPSATTTRVVRGDAARTPMALADFEARVRALIGATP